MTIVDKAQRTEEGKGNDGYLMKIYYRRLLDTDNRSNEDAARLMDEMFLPEWREICAMQ